jgi:hypothetical protein
MDGLLRRGDSNSARLAEKPPLRNAAGDTSDQAALVGDGGDRYSGLLRFRDTSMYRNLLFTVLCALMISCTTGAVAQDISRKASDAEKLLAQGKVAEAIAALDDAAGALWDKAPLSFRRALWVAEKATGFGAFNPRENAAYASDAPMLVYAEPVGFGWRQSGEVWRTELIADLTIKTPDGNQLFQQNDFQKLELASRVRNREFMVNFTYTLSGIPKGEYLLETTLRDQVSGKKGSFSLPFTIR